MKIPKSDLFKKYVFSYLIVFSIPLFILLLMINSFYISRLEKELKTNNSNFLEQASFQLDEQILELNAIGNQLKFSDDLSSYLVDIEENADELIENLKGYEYSTRSAKSIYILLTDRDMVISSDGLMTMEALLTRSNDFKVNQKEQLIDELSSSKENISIYTIDKYYTETQPKQKKIYYILPLRDSNVNNGILVFVLNTNQIQANLDTMREAEGELSFLADEKGDLIVSKGLSNDFSEVDLEQKKIEMIEKGKAKINNKGYIATSKTNILTGWTFVSLVETTQFYFPLVKILVLFVFFIFALIILGMVVSIYFANKHYRPINNLTNVFRLEGDKISDELLFLKSSINKKNIEYIKLNQLMNERAPIIRNSALLNVIEGKHLNNDKFLQSLEKIGLNFPYSTYAVLLVEFKKDKKEADKIIIVEAIVQRIIEEQPNLDEVCMEATVPYLVNNQIIVVVNMNEDTKKTWNRILQHLQDIIKKDDFDQNLVWKVAIGNSYNTIDKIKNSYIEASSALEKMNSRAYVSSHVLFFEELTKRTVTEQQNAAFLYPREEMMLLIQSLKQGNEEITFEILDQLMNKIYNEIHQPIAKQAVIADVFNRVLRTANEFNMNNQYEKIYQLSDFSSTEAAQSILKNIIASICESVESQKDTQNIEMKKAVVEYIYASYDSPEISLGEISAENNISVSYASRLIKEETGKSFSQLIQTLRMEQFKELLLDTQEPIKELITEVGYYDASNFTRKFRLENGMTPSQYRIKYQNEES